MRQIIIILALLALWPGYVFGQINQDTVNSDVPGGGGSGGGGLSSSDIDTLAELNNIITPDVLGTTSSQSMTNKTIDAAANTIKILKGADCTAFDAAVDGQYCWDTDDDLLYVCETEDVCDTSDEWDAVASTSTPSVQSIVIADSGDGNAAIDNDTEITSTLVQVSCLDSDGCELHLSETNAVVGQEVTIFQSTNSGATIVTGQISGSPVLATTCSGAGAELPFIGTDGYIPSVKFVYSVTWQEECITNPILGSVPLADVATSADSADDLDCTGCVGDSELASTFLKSADIDTFSELDTIVADETLVNTNDAQTLTNKTISGADNTLSNIPWASLTGVPAFRKTLVQLKPNGASLPASNFAFPNSRNSIPTLRYNGNVCAFWTFVLPNTYGGNGTTVDIWVVSTETSNDTDWDGSWERIATTQDIDSDSFASAISADNNNNNATSGIPTKVSIAFTDGAQMDSCAAGELCRFRLCRDDTSDTGGQNTIDLVGGEIHETP